MSSYESEKVFLELYPTLLDFVKFYEVPVNFLELNFSVKYSFKWKYLLQRINALLNMLNLTGDLFDHALTKSTNPIHKNHTGFYQESWSIH